MGCGGFGGGGGLANLTGYRGDCWWASLTSGILIIIPVSLGGGGGGPMGCRYWVHYYGEGEKVGGERFFNNLVLLPGSLRTLMAAKFNF